MNSLPLHPSVVHLPIALALLMPAIAAGLLLAWWNGWLPKRSWLVATALQLVLVASAVVALRTGEADEERVERVLASETALHAHEEAAEVFVWASAGVLLLFVVAAALRKDKVARLVATSAVAGAVLVLALGYRVGHAGGELVYIHGAARAYVNTGQTAGSPTHHSKSDRKKHHDDHDEDDDDDD